MKQLLRKIVQKSTHISLKQFIVVSVVIVVFAMIISPGYYFYSRYNELQKLLKNPNQVERDTSATVIKQVGALVDLPTGETPRVMTVANLEKLAGLPFFEKAQSGDKVLMYEKAKKAYLYRPSTNRVINIAPILSTQEVQSNIEKSASSSPDIISPTP